VDGRVLLPLVPFGTFFAVPEAQCQNAIGFSIQHQDGLIDESRLFLQIGSTLSLMVFASCHHASQETGFRRGAGAVCRFRERTLQCWSRGGIEHKPHRPQRTMRAVHPALIEGESSSAKRGSARRRNSTVYGYIRMMTRIANSTAVLSPLYAQAAQPGTFVYCTLKLLAAIPSETNRMVGCEPVGIQAFVPQSAVEAFGVGVLCRLAGLNKLQSHTALFAPGSQGSRPLVHGVQSTAMTNLTSVLNQLQQEHARLRSQLERVNGAISALNQASTNESGRRRISAAGRARISAAQRARWAKAKGQKVVSKASRKRRRMSAAAIARIRAAQKARWAKWRKQKKTA
jgi:hypothetical protein